MGYMMAKIGAIVVLYNWDKETLKNVDSYSPCFDEIILVDNSDKKNAGVKSKSYIYECMNGNFGIGCAINRGIEIAKKHGLDFVVTLDQDSNYKDNPTLYYEKNANDLISNKIIIVPRNYVKSLRKSKNGTDRNPKLLVQSGAMFNMKMFEEVGYFNEDLFIDVVDYEFGIRAEDKEYKIFRCNDIVLNHRPGSPKTKNIFGKKIKYVAHNPTRIYYQSRNLLWTAKKYKNGRMFKIYLRLFLKIVFLFDNKKQNMKMFIRGTKDARKGVLGRISA